MSSIYPTLRKGFTLIELVIVILIMSALGMMTTSYIRNSVDLYTNITTLDKSLGSVRFVMERLRREVGNALPNSIIVKNSCLTFTPIIDNSIYGTDFPISSHFAKKAFIAPISNNINGSKAVVYILTTDELLEGSNKSHLVQGYNAENKSIIFSEKISFPISSPTKRVYFVKDKTTYCFNKNNLYRRINEGEFILMAEHLSGYFFHKEAALKNHFLVQVKYNIDVEGKEVPIEQILRINNKP